MAYLAYPKESAQLLLKTDASDVSLGAILEQVYEDKSKVIGYYSKALTSAQRNHSTYDLELLSVYGSVKYFEYLLLDKPFTIFTDNKSLVNSFNHPSESPNSRQVRQLSYLSQFDCNVVYIAGKDNFVSDALSRVVVNHVLHVDALPFSLESIALEQRAASHLNVFNFSSDSTVNVISVPVPNSNLSI